MIWIRADANREIGTGHVMRCLSVALALQECGQEVCFVLADESAVELLRSKGQKYQILHSDYTKMEEELQVFGERLAAARPQCLLVDSYYVTSDYLKQLGKYTTVAYVDDMNAFAYPVDLLINYNIYGDMLPYKEKAAKENQQFLLGTSYAPLRAEFQNVEYAVRDEVQNVLLTTGGSDKYNLAGQILEKVLHDGRTDRLHYHVVSGAFNPNYVMLKRLEEKRSNVHIHQNVTKMSELMQKCDIAVTAGGSTMYELCAVGVPIICFSFVDNQEQIVQTFVKKDMVCFGGNYLKEQETMLDNIVENIAMLTANEEMRKAYCNKERQLVDGQGAMRIAQTLCGLGIL